MNKAFVREPDEPDPRCPGCGLLGEPVTRATLDANLPPQAARVLSDTACFCANPRCVIAYFDAAGQSQEIGLLRQRVYPKDPAGPICPCTQTSAAQIEADARSGDRTRIRQLLALGQSPDAACARLNPAGRPCAAELQQHFLKHFKPGSKPAR